MAETCRLKKCWRRVNSNDVEAQFTCAICKIPSWMLPAVLQEGIEKMEVRAGLKGLPAAIPQGSAPGGEDENLPLLRVFLK